MPQISHLAPIIDIINRFGLFVDLQEWDALRTILSEEVWIDYSDFDGHEPERVPKETLIRSWQELIAGFDAVQHSITNHVIDRQTVRRYRCRAHVRTYHALSNNHGSNSWTVGAVYTFGLEKIKDDWKIIRIELKPLWSDGNRHLYDEVVEKGRSILA